MRILVTNDDGVDSIGLHVLARAMRAHGEVVVVAPDSEYSGAGCSIGPIWLMRPEVHEAHIAGIDTVWTVNGPPALCVMFANLGAFGGPFDLVVSGINPGSNVGRAVYHSGTVGACLTARNGGISGVAVSQAVEGWSVEGQGVEAVLDEQRWDTAAQIAQIVVGGLVASPPSSPVVCNLNVPNLPVDELQGWRRTSIGARPPRIVSRAELVPKPGHEGGYHVQMAWGDPVDPPDDSDSHAVMNGYVSLGWLTRLTTSDHEAVPSAEQAIEALFHS